MKKSLGIFVGACLVVGFAASVHAAVNGAHPGGGIVTIHGGGTTTQPNPVFYGNCTAYLREYPTTDRTPQTPPSNWMTVAAPTATECNALVNFYVNDPNTSWEVNPALPRCACSEASMGRAIELGGNVPWTLEQEQSLNAELAALKAEYRVDEYYERVRQLVVERMQ